MKWKMNENKVFIRCKRYTSICITETYWENFEESTAAAGGKHTKGALRCLVWDQVLEILFSKNQNPALAGKEMKDKIRLIGYNWK
jgi:hypothetical protein